MSTTAISAVGVPEDELAVTQRIVQLQEMIEQARTMSVTGVSSGGPSTGLSSELSTASTANGTPTTDFASTLQAATMAGVQLPTGSPLPAGPTEASAGAASTQYDSLIEAAAARNGVDPAILHGLIQQESDFDPNAQSGAGAAGLTQLMPGTASSLGVANPLNPAESIEGGARYLAQMMARFGGNTADALAAYNAGPGAVQQYGGVPPYAETQDYVTKVLGYAEAYSQAHATPVTVGGVA